MAKVESRLPFLRCNRPKAYEEEVYIVSENDTTDYSPVTNKEDGLTTSHLLNAEPVKTDITKQTVSGIKSPTNRTSGLKALSGGSKMLNVKASKVASPQRPTSLLTRVKTPDSTCTISPRRTQFSQHISTSNKGSPQISTPVSDESCTDLVSTIPNVRTPGKLIKIQKSAQLSPRKTPASFKFVQPTTPIDKNSSRKMAIASHKQLLPGANKNKPTVPSKISAPQSIRKLSSPNQQNKNHPRNNTTIISKSESRLSRLTNGTNQQQNMISESSTNSVTRFASSSTSSQSTSSQSTSSHVSHGALGTTSSAIIPLENFSPTKVSTLKYQSKPSKAAYESTHRTLPVPVDKEMTTPTIEEQSPLPKDPSRSHAYSKARGVSKSTSQLQKPSKLSPPTKIAFAPGRLSSTNGTPAHSPVESSSLQQCSLRTTSTALHSAAVIEPVSVQQHGSVTFEPSLLDYVQRVTRTNVPTAVEAVHVYSANPVTPVNIAVAVSSIATVEHYDSCQESKLRSFCAPSITISNLDDVDEVFIKDSAMADVSHCYSYLQQAASSSYHKQLVNSFTIKEQLSPTAECHARHMANCLPQPWLSADIIRDSSTKLSRQLIIPQPPLECFDISKSKLQAIVEGFEPVMEAAVKKPTLLSFPSRQDCSLVNSAFKPPEKSTSLLGNLFSKIGGRRILTRPQESPPRVRKTMSLVAPKEGLKAQNRRKPSPKTRQEDVKTTSHITLSPKHKASFQDDSPIRSKEAYYGGAHEHMPRPLDNTADLTQACKVNLSALIVAGNHSTMQVVRDNNALEDSHQHQRSMCNVLKRSDTPISSLRSLCTDNYVTSSDGSFTTPRGLALPSSRTSSDSFDCSMSTIPAMSRSLSHKKKQKGSADNGARFKTNYSPVLRMGLPPCPELPNTVMELGSSALSKVTIAVRLKPESTANIVSSYITADPSRGQLILRDPSNESNMAPSCRRQLAAVPKFFAFDTVFGADAMQMDVCKNTVLEILQSVLQGSDGCVLSFGQSKTGKSWSLIGDDSTCADFGIIPAAISWLYHLVEEQKSKTGTRFSIRISALEIRGKNEELTDLFAHCTPGNNSGKLEKIQLTSTDVYGAQVENLNEMRAPDVEHAGHYLDAALTTSYNITEKSESKSAHFLFTLHIYQHQVETKPSPGGALVAGGRSRLHFIDIGPCAKSSNDGSALTLAALGSAITALLNGQRHFPQKESKLATLLRDSVGHSNCRTCILVHISTQPSHYSDTLQILQLAARIHRMKVRRRNKISSNSSDDTGSTNSNLRRRRGIKMGTSASLSDPDVSSSEQSIDTVIYVPGNKHRHRQQHSTLYESNQIPKNLRANQEGAMTGLLNGCGHFPSPYKVSGATKKRLSDDETSSEGRRRMPRTNARAWPRTNNTENEIWLDAPPPPISRDQWHIPGNANPSVGNDQIVQHDYYNSTVPPQLRYQHNRPVLQPNYPYVMSAQQPSWLSLAQYNGNPEQIAQLTTGGHKHVSTQQAWPEHVEQKGNRTESSKQELWVDGPTAFRKNIEGLTHNLHQDQLSPTKTYFRNHSNTHTGEKGEKSKHHHRTPSRKHREGLKHCQQCGADIKKELKTNAGSAKADEKTAAERSTEEPTLSVKPFVKDWVLRHSKNNTPIKSVEDSPVKNRLDKKSTTLDVLVDKEASIQEDLQLMVDFEGELSCLPDIPCSDNLMNDTSDIERQDEVQIDDSVSNVTVDDRVGFESKEGSSFDENSLSEDVVEVCDAACQTEFSDSDCLSTQSNGIKSDFNTENGITVYAAENRKFRKKESTEAFLNATLQGALLRKPDGASDPSLHKELLSPSAESKHFDMMPQSTSSTLPRNAFLESPKQSIKESTTDMRTIKLQPYLSLPKPSTRQTLKSVQPSTEDVPKSSGNICSPERANKKTESKLKKHGIFKLNYHDGFGTSSLDKQPSFGSAKKSKGSMLPSLRLTPKPKDSKLAVAQPSTPSNRSETTRKEKRCPFKATNKGKSMEEANKQGSKMSYSRASIFDVTSSPYSYNSSCTSHPLAANKYSVSSGYESMTLNSVEDISELGDCAHTHIDNTKTDVWVDLSNQPESSSLKRVSQQRHVESQMSDNVTREARVEQLLHQQDMLKREMAEVKCKLMVPSSTWNYDLQVGSQADKRNDEGYLNILEKETRVLQKRVDACKSRIMLITSIF